jgi:hypothetical protein
MSTSLRCSLAASLLALAACSSGTGTQPGKDAGLDATSAGGGGSGGTGGSASDAGNPTDVVGLAIDPPTATLASVDGSTPAQVFKLLAVQRDGQQVPLGTGEWSPSQSFLGALATGAGGDATFTANGIAGGSADLTAKALGFGGKLLQATATVTVQVQRNVAVPGAPADASTQFAAATPDPAGTGAHLLYPLDGALLPNNVAPLDLQWENGAAGDLYRVTLTKPHLTVTAYVLHSGGGFRFDWTVDALAWRSVAESDPGASTAITVDLLASGTGKVVAGAPVNVRLAQGSLYGAVYYWAINEGRLQNINADTAARTPVMANPPTGCIACHTISRDGRFLAGALDGSPRRLALFDLTDPTALQASPAQPLFTPSLTEVYATFSPDNSRLLVSGFGSDQGGGDGSDGFTLIDSSTGATAPSTGLPPDHHVAHPDWSPDGKSVVYVGNIAGQTNGYLSHYTASDLFVMPVSGTSTLAFGAPALLHHGADATAAEGGTADAHPTWSPDSALVAFQHGQVGYSQFNPNAALYAIAGTPGGAAVRLDNASGGAAGTSAFWPTFSPFTTTEGGVTYYWLAFFSQRDYGNAQAGTRGTARRQLWVTAVRADGTGDPSSVPYWLPGQDTASENAAARWAPVACRANAADCQVSSECCSGSCLPDPADLTHFICTPPPLDQCHHQGQLCGGSGDCCAVDGLVCLGNVCSAPPPK